MAEIRQQDTLTANCAPRPVISGTHLSTDRRPVTIRGPAQTTPGGAAANAWTPNDSGEEGARRRGEEWGNALGRAPGQLSRPSPGMPELQSGKALNRRGEEKA